jgi:catechol 2,3-dioxygenase-like lactoylglutathione lyase family enzyme
VANERRAKLAGMTIKKLTPVLLVDAIEPVLAFWEALGFARMAEVPHGDALGFVILQADGVEVMYQTLDSVRDDAPDVLAGARGPGMVGLFFEVDDLDAIAARVPPAAEVIERRRTTPYGATEMIVRDPAGNAVTFAKFG